MSVHHVGSAIPANRKKGILEYVAASGDSDGLGLDGDLLERMFRAHQTGSDSWQNGGLVVYLL
jgi:hypothetical protein